MIDPKLASSSSTISFFLRVSSISMISPLMKFATILWIPNPIPIPIAPPNTAREARGTPMIFKSHREKIMYKKICRNFIASARSEGRMNSTLSILLSAMCSIFFALQYKKTATSRDLKIWKNDIWTLPTLKVQLFKTKRILSHNCWFNKIARGNMMSSIK